VFGNGKTAVKFNWGKYLAYASNDAPYISSNPAVTVVSSVTNRGWNDANHDHVVNCDLLNAAANGECAAATGNFANFGKTGAATTGEPNIPHGRGGRPKDKETEIPGQAGNLPGPLGRVKQSPRPFSGFFVTDDLNRSVATGYETYTLTAPADARLPGGG